MNYLTKAIRRFSTITDVQALDDLDPPASTSKQLENIVYNYLKDRDPIFYVERNEIQTRILRVLYDSQVVDINKYNFAMDLRRDLELDSLNIVAIITSIEHEFTTVFEDKVFEGCRNLGELVEILAKDHKIF